MGTTAPTPVGVAAERQPGHMHAPVTGGRVEFCSKVIRDFQDHRAVARGQRPIGSWAGPLGPNSQPAIAGTSLELTNRPFHVDAAVAGARVDGARHMFEMNRSISGMHAKIAFDVAHGDTTIARHGVNLGFRRDSDGQRCAVATEVHVHVAVPLFLHLDGDDVTGLLGSHLHPIGGLLVEGMLLDNHEDFRAVPRFDFDIPVEGSKIQRGRTGNRESFLDGVDVG